MRQAFRAITPYTTFWLIFFFVPGVATGFVPRTPSNARWANSSMTLTINTTDFGDGSPEQQAISRGIESWYRLNVPGSALEVNYQTAAIDTTHGNNISGITLGPLPASFLGLTTATYNNTNPPTWKDSDIKLSNSVTWQDYDYAVDAIPPYYNFSRSAVTRHEVGHACGFDHEDGLPRVAVMNRYYSYGNWTYYGMHGDDRNGIRTLYPATGESETDFQILGWKLYFYSVQGYAEAIPVNNPSPSTLVGGQQVVVEYTLENLGTVAADDFHPVRVGFYLTTSPFGPNPYLDRLIGYQYFVISAATGGNNFTSTWTDTTHLTVPCPLPTGTYHIGAYIDDVASFFEDDEMNNGIALPYPEYQTELSITSGAPAIPTNCVATDTRCDSIIIGWIDNSNNEGGFRVYRNGVPIDSVGPNVTRYADRPAANMYSYKVVATKPFCDSDPSAPDNGTRLSAPSLAPSGVDATDTSCNEILVSWSWSGSGQTGFKVYRDGGEVYSGISAGERSWSDTGTTPNVIYAYSVRAYNTCPDLGPVSATNDGTKVSPPPGFPSVQATTNNCSTILVSWVWGGSGQTGFDVYRDGAANPSFTTSGVSWSDAPSVGPHSYEVRARYPGNCQGPRSSPAVTGVRRGSPPSTPTGITASDYGCSDVAISWNWNPSGPSGTEATGFKVVRAGVVVLTGADPSQRSWADAGGTPDVTYAYQVRAYNECADGPLSPSDNGSRRQSPPTSAATSVQATDGGFCCDFIRVTWAWTGTTAQGFKIFRDNTLVHTGTSSGERSWDDTSVSPGSGSNPHDYYVLAYNGCGDGPPSNHDSGFRCTPLTWMTNGVPVCTKALNQYYPASISDGAGGAIIVWLDDQTTNHDVYAQHLTAAGNPCWATDGVPLSTSTGDKSGLRITPDGGGGAFIAWDEIRSGVNDIYVQHINTAGVVSMGPEGHLLCPSTPPGLPYRTSPDLIPYDFRGALVTWSDQRNGEGDIYALAIDSTGNSYDYSWPTTGVPICTAAGIQDIPRITLTKTPSGWQYCVIAWQDSREGPSSWHTYAQKLEAMPGASRVPMWAPTGIRITATPYPLRSIVRLAPDGDAGAIVSWENDDPYPSYHLYAQRVDHDGALPWGASGIRLSTAPGAQGSHDIISDGAGGAILSWADLRDGPGDIYSQRIGSNGAGLWSPNGLPVCTAPGRQSEPRLVSDGAGGAVLAWIDERVSPNDLDIFARRVNAQGGLIGPSNSLPVTTSPAGQYSLTLAQGVPGSAIVTWGDGRAPAWDIYSNVATPQGVTPPGVELSYFVPQSGSLATPSEGAQALINFRTCPNTDGTQVLRFSARLKVVLRTEDNTPLVGVPPDSICMLFNGGTPGPSPGQGFSGAGDDSIIANFQYNQLANCPDVRCVQADAPTDFTGSTFITLLGATPGSPGVATRDPSRKWGGYAGDIPVRVLGVNLEGRLTSASTNGTYTAHVRNLDSVGGRTIAPNQGELINSFDINAVQFGIGGPYTYHLDMDGNGLVNSVDLSFVKSHENHKCNVPIP